MHLVNSIWHCWSLISILMPTVKDSFGYVLEVGNALLCFIYLVIFNTLFVLLIHCRSTKCLRTHADSQTPTIRRSLPSGTIYSLLKYHWLLVSFFSRSQVYIFMHESELSSGKGFLRGVLHQPTAGNWASTRMAGCCMVYGNARFVLASSVCVTLIAWE